MSGNRLYDLTTRELLATLEGRYVPGQIVFSPDGRRLAGIEYVPVNSGGSWYFGLWRVEDGKLIATKPFPNADYAHSPTFFAFSGDSRKAVAGNDGDGSLTLYQAGTGVQIWSVGTDVFTKGIGFSTDGESVINAGTNRVEVRNAADGALQHSFDLPGDGWWTALSPTGNTVAAIKQPASSPKITIWRVSDGALLHTIEVPFDFSGTDRPDLFYDLIYNATGEILASRTGDGPDHWAMWQVSAGLPIPNPPGLTEHTEFSPDGRSLIGWDASGYSAWSLSDGRLLFTHPFLSNEPGSPTGVLGSVSAHVSPDGSLITVQRQYSTPWGGSSGGSDLYRFQSGELLDYLGPYVPIGYTPDGKALALEHNSYLRAADGSYFAGDPLQGQSEIEGGQPQTINASAFSPDGNLFAVGYGEDSYICYPEMPYCTGSLFDMAYVWNTLTGETVLSIDGPGAMKSLDFSPDGNVLAIGSGQVRVDLGLLSGLPAHGGPAKWIQGDDNVRLWDINRGAVVQTLTGHTAKVTSVRFSPDSSTLASVSADGAVKFWDVSSGRLLRASSGPGGVRDARFTPDGSLVIALYDDGSVAWWDASTGDLLQQLPGGFVALSPDYLAAVTGDEARFYRTSDGALAQSYTGVGPDLKGFWISPDRTSFTYQAHDGTVTLARLTEDPSLAVPPVRGDVVKDGTEDVADVVKTLRFAVGLDVPTPLERMSAEVSGDGRVDILDAVAILQYLVGIRETL